MSDKTKDLIKRLRANGQKNFGLYAEAADALEALTCEVASLNDALRVWVRENAPGGWINALRKNQILGSDVVVKVDTHGSPELDEDAIKLMAMGQDPGMTLNQLIAPAADPAPVCEWRYVAAGNVWLTECEERCNGWTTKIGKTECQFCDGAIKFTETEE